MISITTRNRPRVLEYTLKRTREAWSDMIIVIDDASDCAPLNEEIAKKYDCAYILNNTRWGIPRSKERGFRSLLSFNRQLWLDDDCFPLPGFWERLRRAEEEHPHLLHLKEWTHIKQEEDLGEVVRYSGATACAMYFHRDVYPLIHGFQAGFGYYGGWHHTLSEKVAGGYFALKDSPFHSFDIDGVPRDFDSHFCSSLPQHERIKK